MTQEEAMLLEAIIKLVILLFIFLCSVFIWFEFEIQIPEINIPSCIKPFLAKIMYKSRSEYFRMLCADWEYYLDVLKNDPSAWVRLSVLEQEYLPESFLDDPDPDIRDKAEKIMRKIAKEESGMIQAYIDKLESFEEESDISDILHGISAILKKMITIIIQNPSKEKKCRHLKEYYLPALIKALEQYQKIEDIDLQNDQLANVKKEITESLLTMQNAFENLLVDLISDDQIDVKADLTAVQMLMEQDGILCKHSTSK